ncbi:helix-turn-helix transcriptional regulator [Anaerohalosphaeraceae bacterium U12dextr]
MNEANTVMMDEKLWTVKQVAEFLRVSVWQVHRLSARGLMPGPLRLGRCFRWLKEDVLGWIDAGAPDRKTWKQMKAERKG